MPEQSTRAPARKANRGDTHVRILDVAENIFARYGYLAARIDDIAEAVGIRRPSLFHHFRNKQALYRAVLDRWIERQADAFDRVLRREPAASPEVELELLVEATFDFLIDHPNFAYLTLHTLGANRAEEVPTEVTTISMDRWRDTLERGRRAGRFRDVGVAQCMALIGGMTTFYIAMPSSRTDILSAIREVDSERLKDDLQRMIKTLVLIGQPNTGA